MAGLSCEAVALIRKLLEKDLNKRFTAAEAYRHGWILKNGYCGNDKLRSLLGYDPVSHGVKLWALQHAIDDYELVHFELVFLHSDSNLDGFLDVDELSEYLKTTSSNESRLIISHGYWTVPCHLNFYEFISVIAPSSFWQDHYTQILSELPFKFPVKLKKLILFLKGKLGNGRFSKVFDDREITQQDFYERVLGC